MIDKDFKKIIEREKHKYSYDELGRTCGLSGVAIRNYHKKDRYPNILTAQKLLNFLGYDIKIERK